MRIIFAGTPENAALGLDLVSKHHEVALVITREDAEVGRKRLLTPSPVAQKASELGLPLLKANRVGGAELELVSAADAEIALVIAFGSLIPQSALDALPWWNIHFSLLPLWRGASPLQQSILSGGVGAGVSLFELDAGMDTGPILAQTPIQPLENETTGEALTRFTVAGIDLFLDAAEKFPVAKPQVGDATYAPKLDRQSARLGLGLNALEVHRVVMAFNPEPMAWCELNGSPVRILESRSMGKSSWVQDAQKPGRVTKSAERILLECGEGTQLELVRVQPAGKQVMPAADWYRGLGGEVVLA
ncbi:MAG: methionyl-tRNA formyltransferase [Actinomycetota bacterium]|nr:methionyl-tRNA formyltransferase [Actinomycetota bacterium]